MRNCCVPKCKFIWKKGSNIRLHRFPKDKSIRKKWVHVLKMGRKPSETSMVCGDHFKADDYKMSNYGDLKGYLKTGTIPSQKLPQTSVEKKFKKPVKERSKRLQKEETMHDAHNDVEGLDTDMFDGALNADVVGDESQEAGKAMFEALMNADVVDDEVVNYKDASTSAKPNVRSIGNQTPFTTKRISFVEITDTELIYATGFERPRFNIIHEMLEKFQPLSDNEFCSKKDSLLIAMFKLRHNLDFKMIEFTFGIPRTTVSGIFTEVVEKLYYVLKRIDIWNISYKGSKIYVCIIDCTEFYVVRANDPSIHQLTYSTYKHDTTFKLLVSCDENGGVNFISDVFVGSISDREIVIKSGILDKLNCGEAVMADKGFDISDLLHDKGVLVNIPPFRKGKSQFTPTEVMKTRKIANKRIIIENVNGRAKQNRIISGTMTKNLWPLANKIIYIYFAFVNFYKPLK